MCIKRNELFSYAKLSTPLVLAGDLLTLFERNVFIQHR